MLQSHELIGYEDAELLLSIQKADILRLFQTHIDPQSPTRAKLSVHIIAQKPRIKKVSEAASRAFQQKLRLAGFNCIEVDERELFSDGPPTLTDFTQFWTTELAGREDAATLLAEINPCMVEHPIEGEDVNPILPKATYIKDVHIFKQNLSPSVDPGPMTQWGDLPTSKF